MENIKEEEAVIFLDDDTNEGLTPELLEQNPYPGLNSYDEKRADYFQGRDKEKNNILQILDLYSLCFLIGKSGLGKTSLINAGLIPELKRTGFVPIQIRINFDDNVNLSLQVKTIIENDIKAIDPTAIAFGNQLLWEYFQQVKIFNGYLKPVLIFDQFEEIFTRGQKRQAELNDLLAEIIDLAENKIPQKVQQAYTDKNQTIPSGSNKDYRIIFSLREDYLPQLTSLKNHIPTLKFSTYRLEQIAGSEAFKAVFLPAQKGKKGLLDKETAWEIIKKMPESNDDELDIMKVGQPEEVDKFKGKKIEPFLLNLFCYTLNEERKEKNAATITKADVLNKNLEKLVKDYYEKITKVSWRLSAAIEAELITPDGKYRKFSSESDFIYGAKLFFISGKLKESDVQYLVDKKIIRRKRINDINYFELIHDILVPVVLQKRKIRHIIYRAVTTLLIAVGLLFAISGYYKLKLLQTQNIIRNQAKTIREKDRDIEKIVVQLKEQNKYDTLAKKEAQQNLIDSLNKNGQTDSTQRHAQLAMIQQGQVIQTQQKTQLDSFRSQAVSAKLQQVAQQNKLQQKTAAQISQDSTLRMYEAERLATLAEKLHYVPAKRSAAKLAYDTLPEDVKNNQDFIPALFGALTGSLIDNLTNKKLYHTERGGGFKNLNGILISGNDYYLSQPFKSITAANGSEILKEPDMIKSWINGSGDIIAIETLNDDKRSKTLSIKNFKDNSAIDNIKLAVNQDVVSLLFDAGTNTCIYSTKQPSMVYQLLLKPAEQPAILYNGKNLKNNEYLFLADERDNKFTAISNLGKYIAWSSYSKPVIELTANLALQGNTISAITASDEFGRGLFIGCIDGAIYRVGSRVDLDRLPSEPNVKVTSIEMSADGNWLAAGYLNNYINLWRLDLDNRPVVNLLNSTELNKDDISSLKFMPGENELIAISSLGYSYQFPLSMKTLANKICTSGNFITNNEQWKKYMPTVKFQSICK